MYFLPQKHVCAKGHEFDFSVSWLHDGVWPYPVTATQEPHCPICYRAFIAEHVPLGVATLKNTSESNERQRRQQVADTQGIAQGCPKTGEGPAQNE